jgi:hypothetical protein
MLLVPRMRVFLANWHEPLVCACFHLLTRWCCPADRPQALPVRPNAGASNTGPQLGGISAESSEVTTYNDAQQPSELPAVSVSPTHSGASMASAASRSEGRGKGKAAAADGSGPAPSGNVLMMMENHFMGAT